MPPKGWKKDAQGNYPTTSYIKEQEKIRVDDLLFPKSIITSLAREAVQQLDTDNKLLISKDASLVLQRSSTVFVNHLIMYARELAQNNHRKSCNEEDIFKALDHMGMGGFNPIIRDKMVNYEQAMQQKKAESAKVDEELSQNGEEDQAEDDVEQDEEDTNTAELPQVKKNKVDLI